MRTSTTFTVPAAHLMGRRISAAWLACAWVPRMPATTRHAIHTGRGQGRSSGHQGAPRAHRKYEGHTANSQSGETERQAREPRPAAPTNEETRRNKFWKKLREPTAPQMQGPAPPCQPRSCRPTTETASLFHKKLTRNCSIKQLGEYIKK